MFFFGLISGALVLGGLVFTLMPKMMISRFKSRFDYDTTVARINEAIEDNGWSNKGVRYFDQEIQKNTGSDIGGRVTAIHLCKAVYAKRILGEEKLRFVSAIMPCTISVWEDKRGEVFISKMNTGLMGKMFGGIIAEIMGKKVAKEEHHMLSGIIQ